MKMIPMYLVTALFFGAIPLSFTIISALFVFLRHRPLVPVVIALALYQVICGVALWADQIPSRYTIVALAIVLPVAVALSGSIWTVATTKDLRKRVCGIGISTIGCALTGCQVALYVSAILATV